MEAMGFLCCGLPTLVGMVALYAKVPSFRRGILLFGGILGGLFLLGIGYAFLKEGRDRPVLEAARRGDLLALSQAIERGGSPNAGVGDDATIPALMLAVQSGSAPCVEFLLRHGATPNIASLSTPLAEAESMRRIDLVRLLRRYGAR